MFKISNLFGGKEICAALSRYARQAALPVRPAAAHREKCAWCAYLIAPKSDQQEVRRIIMISLTMKKLICRIFVIQALLLLMAFTAVKAQITPIEKKTDTIARLAIRYINANLPDNVYFLTGETLPRP
jgi:hypothetical protein